jgi:hypothetical protein
MIPPIELQDSAEKPTSSPLGHLNLIFHEEHQYWKDRAVQTITDGKVPVVIRLDDRLVLVNGQQQSVFQINGDKHHELKALSHIPLAVYLSLMRPAYDRLHLSIIKYELETLPDIMPTLKVYSDPIRSAVDELIISVSVDGGIVAYEAVKKFAGHLKPIFQKLVAEAAHDEVAQLMKEISRIKLMVDDEQWSQMYYVICGGNQPRYKQITKLFFTQFLLQETNSESEAVHRVIYAESCINVEDALNLVSARIVSANLGEVFLHSPLSLDEDVLGDAGLSAIKDLFTSPV